MLELKQYGWDCESELAELKPEHIQRLLNLYLSGKVSGNEVSGWAKSIERRDDIGFLDSHKEVLDEMVFWLASPEINYAITQGLANRIITNLQNNIIVWWLKEKGSARRPNPISVSVLNGSWPFIKKPGGKSCVHS